MSAAVNSGTLALQLEKVRRTIPQLWFNENVFLTKLQAREDLEVSTRPTRVPLDIQAGGNGGVVNLDGGDMGRGSAGSRAVGLLSNAYYRWAIEWSELSEVANDSTGKSIQNYVEKEVGRGIKNFRAFLDSLVQGNGSDSLDTVTAYTVGDPSLTVTTPARFSDQQILQIVTGAIGGAVKSTVTITYVDYLNKKLFLTAAPGGTAPAAGDTLIAENATNVANSGMAGIQSYQVSAAGGTFLSLNRASFPGRLTTPYQNGGGLALAPAFARLLLNSMRIRNGVENGIAKNGFFYMNLDQEAAWENTGTVITQNIFQQVTGDSSVDQLKKMPPKNLAGYPIIPSVKATQGRIDFIDEDHWFKQEIYPLDFYEVDGKTMFPIYGASGGLASTKITYLVFGGNIGNDDPAAGAYSDNLLIPAGY
jgi:hypothetical protein